MPIGSDILLNEARCLGCGGLSQAQMIVVALLNRIAEAGGGADACENLEGIESPLNVITPDFVGQVFVQSDGTIWQAGSLLSSSWTVICDGANDEGLVWGPAPETVDSVDGANDAFLTNLTARFPTSAYTELSFGQPTTVTNNIDFTGSVLLTSLSFRLLQSAADISVSGIASLTTLNLPMLQTVSILDLQNTGVSVLQLPLLASISTELSIANTLITTMQLPSLVNYPAVAGITADGVLLTLSLPVCVDDGGNLQSDLLAMTGLVTLNLNALVTPSLDFDLTASPNLANINLSAMIAPDGTNFNFLGCSLTQVSVDHILARLVSNPAYISGTVDLSGGTNAAPGVQGAADVITLTGRGVIVTTN